VERYVKVIQLQSLYSFTPPWETRRRAAQVAPWRRLEKSRNRSTDSYAVHCPGVATINYCLWSPPALANTHARATALSSIAWLANKVFSLIIITIIIKHGQQCAPRRKTLARRWVNNAIHGRKRIPNSILIYAPLFGYQNKTNSASLLPTLQARFQGGWCIHTQISLLSNNL